MTPIASNTPGFKRLIAPLVEPLSSGSTPTERNTTAHTMTPMLTSANPELLDSLTMSLCSDSGNDTAIVHSTMINRLSTSSRSPACSLRNGNTNASTCGMLSPIITLNAHMPPNANANWKKETAPAPARPNVCDMTSIYESRPLSLALSTTRRIVQSVTAARTMRRTMPVTKPACRIA